MKPLNQETSAFIFPGQGSQYVGMGIGLVEANSFVAPIFQQADAALNFPISNLAFYGPAEILNKTFNAQPALVMVSAACLEIMRYQSILPDLVAGHSLGEYSALFAAEVLSLKDTLRLVRCRGELMEKAYPAGKGGMAAIIQLGVKELEKACSEAAEFGYVGIANYNCPGQLVISGEKLAVDKASLLAKERGATRVVPLNVSGPFHSPLMEDAAKAFAVELEKYDFKNPKMRFFTNVGGKELTSGEQIKRTLVKQLTECVSWDTQIRTMIRAGAKHFHEVGPGRVLSGFLRRIDKELSISNMGGK